MDVAMELAPNCEVVAAKVDAPTGDTPKGDAADERVHRTVEMARLSPASQFSVLVVDDEEPLRELIARGLRRAGYKVYTCGDVQQGLLLREIHQPQILLADLHLPDGNGGTLVREWKRIDPTLPALVLTGSMDAGERLEAFDVGADDVLRKPFILPELIRRVGVHARTLQTTEALRVALTEVDRLRLYAAEAVALLAHDLNNGLTVVQSNLFLLNMEMPDDPGVRESADTALRVLRRMGTLVKNFVDVARSEDGVLKPALEEVNVVELVKAASGVHHVRGRSDGGAVDVTTPTELSCRMDPILVERVLHNLLINASRYVDSGGQVAVCVRTEGEGAQGQVVIEVANTGPAIPTRLRDRLFEKYRKGDDGRAQTGMGLYFCRLACEAHGGSIALVDCPPFATCFQVRLPLAR